MGRHRGVASAGAGTEEGFVKRLFSARKRLAPLVLIVGALVIAPRIMRALPRETDVSFQLGPEHTSVRELMVSYELDGEEIAGGHFRYEEGAPGSIRQTLDLAPGRYEVHVEVTYDGGRRRVMHRSFSVPADGLVRLDAFEAAIAFGVLRGPAVAC